MGFRVITPNRTQDSAATVLVGIKVYGGGHRFVLTLAEKAVASLKWQNGDKIEIAAGDGDDAGKLQLRPGKQGYTLRPASEKSTRFGLKCVPWSECPDEYAMVEAEFSINAAARTLNIKLPWSADQAAAAE